MNFHSKFEKEDHTVRLYIRHQKEGWTNFKLELHSDKNWPKKNWWLAWNGQRLSRTKDAYLLERHQPEIYEWVIDVCKGM
jgi:hypothetical protein